MIDIHCHLLPGIDDGPATTAESLALARALLEDGITHVVCTPHVFPGRFDNVRSGIAQAHAAFVRDVLAPSGLALATRWAGEVRLTPEVLDDLLPRAELPWLGGVQAGQQLMLLELPDGQVPLGAERFVSRLQQHGTTPVIVHPERNREVMDDPDRLEPFIRMGCPVQLTAASITGHFGSKAQDCAFALLDAGWVTAVASDAHNLQGRRPRMKQAHQVLADTWGPEVAEQLTRTGPAHLCGWMVPAA